MTSIAPAAGTAVSQGDRSGPTRPRARAVPSTATATKFTELLMRKKATERLAIRSAGIPPSRRIQAPRARPPAPLAGTIEPGGELGQADLPARPPRHVLAEDGPEQQHVGHARHGLECDGQRDPLRLGLGQQVADLAEPGREQQHEADRPRAPRRSGACASRACWARTRPAS